MTFSEVLNQYLSELECTAKRLSQETGISITRISRYRNGITTPASAEEVAGDMAKALARIATEKKITSMTEAKIYRELLAALDDGFDQETLRDKVNALIDGMGINLTRLAMHCNYSVSNMSKICRGKRITRSPQHFARSVSEYVVRNYIGKTDCMKVAEIMGKDNSIYKTPKRYKDEVYGWLIGSNEKVPAIKNFIGQMDEFDMDEFLRAKKIGKVRIPTMPIQLPARKRYVGIKGMEEGIISFLKATVLSKATRDVIIYSDHPMEHCMKNIDFVEQWMKGLAGLVLKGIRINIIHNLDRPFEEVMMGLESWIPLYMTGLVNPYYMENVESGYNHLMLVSGVASMCGDAIRGYPESGRYFFSKANPDVVESCTRAEQLLSSAKPIVEIYTSERRNELTNEILKNARNVKLIKSILTAPPIFTISDDLLMKILSHNDVSEDEACEIRNYIHKYREGVKSYLKYGICDQSAPIYTSREMILHPVSLALSGLYMEKDIHYSYEEYFEHIAQSKEFADDYDGYIFDVEGEEVFRNVQINVFEEKCVVASKGKAPVIHFISKHPKIIKACSNMVMVITEEGATERSNKKN